MKNLLRKMMGGMGGIPGKRRSKPNNPIASLIGAGIIIDGTISFSDGLRLDGKVNGNIVAVPGQSSTLVLGEHGQINGEISGTHLVLNGMVDGPVRAEEYLELQSHSRIAGNVHYKYLEIQLGAIVEGRLMHLADAASDKVVAFKQKNGAGQR